MSDQALTQSIYLLEGLLGHSIEDQPDQRFRAIHELLDRHGTGRILFVIHVKPFRASQVVIVSQHHYQHQKIGQKMANCVNRCGLKKRKLMVHGCKMIRVCHGNGNFTQRS